MTIKNEVLQMVQVSKPVLRAEDVQFELNTFRTASEAVSLSTVRSALWSLVEDKLLVAMVGADGKPVFGEQRQFEGTGYDTPYLRPTRGKDEAGVTISLPLGGDRFESVSIEQARIINRQLKKLFGEGS